jgi:hypothetical protein
MLVLLFGTTVILAQGGRAEGQEKAPAEEKKKPKPKAGDITFEGEAVKIADSNAARQQIVRFQKEWKAAGKNESKKVEALERLAKWDHPSVLAEAKKNIKDKSHLVSIAAVKVCVRQTSDKKKTGGALLSALGREKRTGVRCALLVGMGYMGYDTKKARKAAWKYFRRDTLETHKAATRYLGYIKDKSAFRALAEKLDEPHPANPNDPNNPPASYWRARWNEWNTNVPHTRWAISQLVPGETFESKKEAKDWAKSEGKKHGIEW